MVLQISWQVAWLLSSVHVLFEHKVFLNCVGIVTCNHVVIKRAELIAYKAKLKALAEP